MADDIQVKMLEYLSKRRKEINEQMFEQNGYTPKRMTKPKWAENSGKIQMINEMWNAVSTDFRRK